MFCCVQACSNYMALLPRNQLSRLPYNQEHLRIFCEVLGIDPEMAERPGAMVCSKHFKSKQGQINTPTDIMQMVSSFSLSSSRGVKGSLPPPSSAECSVPVSVPPPTSSEQQNHATDSPAPDTSDIQSDPPSSPGSEDSLTSSSSEAAENMEPVTLALECEEETLSTSQLNAYMKDLMAYCSANEIVYRIQNSGVTVEKNTPSLSSAAPTESNPSPQLLPFKAPAPSPITSVPNLLSTAPFLTPTSVPAIGTFLPATTSASAIGSFLPATTSSASLPATTVSTIGSYVTTGSASALCSFLPVSTSAPAIGSYVTTGSVPAIVSYASAPTANTTVTTSGSWLISSPSVSSMVAPNAALPMISVNNPVANKFLTKVVQHPVWPAKALQISPTTPQNNVEVIPSPPTSVYFPEVEEVNKRNLGERTYSARTGSRFPTLHPKGGPSSGASPPTVSAAPTIAGLRFSGAPLTTVLQKNLTELSNVANYQNTMMPGQIVGAVSVNSIGVAPRGLPPPYQEMTNSAIGGTEPIPQSFLEVQISEKDDFQMPNRTEVTWIEQPTVPGVAPGPVPNIIPKPRGPEYTPLSGRPLSGTLFSLVSPVPVLQGGATTVSREEEYLKVRLTPPKNRLHEADQLRKQLQGEHYITSSGHWLLANKVLLPHTACSQCGCKIFLLARDETQQDGFAVTCARQRCQHSTPIRRPGFLELFPRSRLETLLLLSYHWACLSPFEEMKQDLEEVEPSEVSCFYRATRRLCRHKLIGEKIGGKGTVVEIAVYKVGEFFVTCAFERWRSVVCLETYTEAEAYSPTFVVDFVRRFLKAETPLVTQLGNPVPKDLVTVTAGRAHVQDPRSPLPHTLNAEGFLKRHLDPLFRWFRPPEHRDFLQELMDELSWRTRFGTTVQEAFKNLFLHIKALDKAEGKAQGDGSIVHKSTKAFNTYYAKMSPKLKLRWSDKSDESNTMPKTTNGIKKTVRKRTAPIAVATVPKVSPTPWVPSFCTALFKEVPSPAVNRGKKLRLTRQTVLACRVPITAKDSAKYYDQVVQLGVRLRSEGFIATPLAWLVEHKYLPGVSTCARCHQVALLKDTSEGEGEWQCTHHTCGHCTPYRRPAVLRRSPLDAAPLPQVAASAYHWCVGSESRLVGADAPALQRRLTEARTVYQGAVWDALRRREAFFEGEVEVALVHRGPVLVLGALERRSGQCRAQCLGYKRATESGIYAILRKWIKPHSTIVAYVNPDNFKPDPYTVVVSPRLQVTPWLLSQLEGVFGHLEPAEMTTPLVQPYLEEARWRRIYAPTPRSAFDHLMAHLFEENGKKLQPREAITCVLSSNKTVLPPLQMKEARVVLKRLSKKILRRYKCTDLEDDDSSVESSEESTVGERPLSTSSSSSSSGDDDDVDMGGDVSDEEEESEDDRPLQKLVICKGKTTDQPHNYFIKDSSSSDDGSRHSSKVESEEKPAEGDCGVRTLRRPLSADDESNSSRWVDGLATRELRQLRKTESYCAECGETVTSRMDHFMKQFSCSDCRYSTCCQSAFFLHRGSVLFGRRTAAVRAPYGLHRPQHPLHRPLRCARCALTSPHPKIMMSHLLRCGRGTCIVNT